MEIIRKKNYYVLLCCIAFFLCNFDSALVAAKEMVFDVVALMEIKSRLVDPYGVLDSWDEAVPDPCSWNMITCSTDYQVIALEAPDRGLSGTLSPYIGNLTYIQSVRLQSNNLTGNIPLSIGALSNLRTIELSNNKFSGQIPSSISHLESLQYLRLNNNSLSGEIPPSLANMTQLTNLDLSFNNLSGPLPRLPTTTFNGSFVDPRGVLDNSFVDPRGVLDNWDEAAVDPCSWNLVTCSSDGLVVGLKAISQNLSGTLAPTIGNLTNLQLVFLQNNSISGHIPSELGKLPNLHTLDLSINNFSGQIPSSLSHSKSLQFLGLSNNSLSGAIPPSLANMTQLTSLDLSFNNLSGPLPRLPTTAFKGLSIVLPSKDVLHRNHGLKMKEMEFRKEKFAMCYVSLFCLWTSACGLLLPNKGNNEVQALIGMKNSLVDPLGVLESWDEDAVDVCSWSLVTCPSDGLVVHLKAASQNLSGTLAPTIGNLTNLQLVLLQNNNISGYIPSQLGKLPKLQTLDLSSNNFYGQIPSSLSHLESLHYLRLNNNSLSGAIPPSLANMTQLSFLDLSFNNLSGPFPGLPTTTFNIVGNPYICSNGADKKMEVIRKKKYVLLCCMAFFCLCNCDSASVAPTGVNNEVTALMGIKNLLDDPYRVLNNWDESSPDPCSWNMITCSPDGLVVGLGAPSQNLSGTLSPTIGNLFNLQLVLLQNNNISGDIPPEIGTLSKLQTIDLSNNKFSGHIPSSISHLKSLQYLRLNNNSLSGEIPDSLVNLTQLTYFDLSFNNLSGDVPKLHTGVFNIEGNPNICSNGANKKVGCDRDVMDLGSLPSSSSSIAKLKFPAEILYTLPFELSRLPILENLYLDNNKLSVVPAELGELKTLKLLVVDYSRLVSVPVELRQTVWLVEQQT
ncbi:Leucine-rich repeat, typical subtype [Corchorus capsularis]|uniref:Leucine-rich repeat, typical subtype n=1 Tax=Corchorus capsularis TaxID=210143 RepID=A0A1R3JFV6_COCAP|nr:Leucine-rich repeat, typical subtype [Corchorus capsularis]